MAFVCGFLVHLCLLRLYHGFDVESRRKSKFKWCLKPVPNPVNSGNRNQILCFRFKIQSVGQIIFFFSIPLFYFVAAKSWRLNTRKQWGKKGPYSNGYLFKENYYHYSQNGAFFCCCCLLPCNARCILMTFSTI